MALSPLSRCSAALIALASAAALAAQVVASAGHYGDLSLWAVMWRLLRYFTILTNLIVCGTFLRAAATGRGPGPTWVGGVVVWIVVVGVVNYTLLLRSYTGLQFWADIGLHAVVPVAVLLWWLIWGERGQTWRAALLWLIWPLVYVVYALIRGGISGRYPYDFIDPGVIGWSGLALWVPALAGVFLLAGLALVALARRL